MGIFVLFLVPPKGSLTCTYTNDLSLLFTIVKIARIAIHPIHSRDRAGTAEV